MSKRLPNHTIDTAPAGARPILQNLIDASPAKRFLNLHAEMAHAPAVLSGYTALRSVIIEHGTLEQKVGAALAVTTAARIGNAYMLGIASRIALMHGWTEAQIAALRTCAPLGAPKMDALIALIGEAAANAGTVSDATWQAGLEVGWTSNELAEAFAHLGLTLFTGYFLNYAQTELDALW
jgi:hypothetical protein